jgi:hypothetical protein
LRTLATGIAVLGLVGATAPTAQASSPSPSAESCSKIQKKAKKAKKAGAAKKAKRLQKRSRSCRKQVNRLRTVVNAISGYTFTGKGGDGLPMNLTFCPDGKWISYERDIRFANRGDSWYVRELDYTSSTKWVTQVGENKDRSDGGFGIGLARAGDTFQVGIASFDAVTDLGPATGSSGAALCATL